MAYSRWEQLNGSRSAPLEVHPSFKLVLVRFLFLGRSFHVPARRCFITPPGRHHSAPVIAPARGGGWTHTGGCER